MQKYKALMLDLDGTTLPNRRDGLPSEKVIKAIAKAQKVINVCIVTARPFYVALPILELLKIASPCVIDGGAQVYDPISQKFLYEQHLEESDAKFFIQFASKNSIPYLSSNGFHDRSQLKGHDKYKLFDILYRNLTNEQADQFITDFSDRSHVSFHKIVSWDIGTIALKISHVTATKQLGIVKISEHLQINPHEIIGVGDSYNDFPLLMASGLKIAMGNAVDDLKEVADYIAPSVDDDGVVDVIERFVLR